MFDLLKYAGHPCLEGDGRAYSYAEVHHAAGLMQPAFEGRSLVLCLCENSIPAMLGYIAMMVHGQVPLLAEAGLKAPALQAMVAAYRPRYVWMAEQRSAELPGAEAVYRLDHYVLLRLAHAGQDGWPMDARLQLLLTTSGSTGSSKLVRLSRANLLANAASITEYLGIAAEDVAVTTLPFSYSFGLSIVNTHLLAGASIQVTELTPLSREFWELVQLKRVTSLSGVPYTYDMLKRIKFERFDLGAIRYLSQAGGKMSQQGLAYLQRLSAEKGWPCFVMYGQTEATARMSYLPAEWLERKAGSIGRAIPQGRVDISGADGALLETPLAQGELLYSGPNVALGYAVGGADLALGDEWGGKLHTGDIAYRDEDGFYYIAGRLKRFVKIFGNRISLDEVEAMLLAAYPACEFVCHGQDDRLRVACVGGLERDELLGFVSRQLSVHRTAISCDFIAEIPRLGNGKVNYNALDQQDRLQTNN
jgi:acyl-CoA synthetase (AMP-forming)/AMP-acid ligase II